MRVANKAKTQPPQEGDEFNKGRHLLGSVVSLAGDLNGDNRDPLVGADCSWRSSSRVRKGTRNSEIKSAIPLTQPLRPTLQAATALKDQSINQLTIFISPEMVASKVKEVNQVRCFNIRATSRLNSKLIYSQRDAGSDDRIRIRLSEEPGFQTLIENRQ